MKKKITIEKPKISGRISIKLAGLILMLVFYNSFTQAQTPCDTIASLGPDTTICMGDMITLDAGTSGLIYEWNTGETTETITAMTAGTFSVTVDNGSGCSASDSIEIFMDNIMVDLGPDTTICMGDWIMLDAGMSGMTYMWNSGETTQTITAMTAGEYSVTVSNGQCWDADTIEIFMDSLMVDLGPDSTICMGDWMMLDAGMSGMTYMWNSGETTQTITAMTAGEYSVTVSNGQCWDADTIEIFVDTILVDLGPDTTICMGDMIVLDAGYSGFSYYWSTGDTTQTITAMTAGTYSIIVYNDNCWAVDTVEVMVDELMVDLGSDTTLCMGEWIMLDAGTSGMTYMWSSGETTQTITAMTAGEFSVTVSSGQCWDADTIEIFVDTILVDLGPDTTICMGDMIVLDAGYSGFSYYWSTGDTTRTITAMTAGTYSIIVYNDNCWAVDTVEVMVDDLMVNLGSDTTICPGDMITLDAGTSGLTYEWNTGATTQMMTVSSAGTYSVTVTSAYCMAMDSIDVSVGGLVVDLGPDTTLCEGDTLILDAGYPNLDHIWCSGETYPTILVTQSGTYCVTVTNDSGCTGMDTIEVTFVTAPDLTLTTTNHNDSVTITADPGWVSYIWSTGETTSSITVNSSGTVWVQAESSTGCIVTKTINISIGLDENLNLSGITLFPNPNDKVFRLKFEQLNSGDLELRIMNILGEMVYVENIVDFSGVYNKQIDISHASGGIYFLEVSDGNEVKRLKFVSH